MKNPLDDNTPNEMETAVIEQAEKTDKPRDEKSSKERLKVIGSHPDAYMSSTGKVSLSSPTSIMMLVKWHPGVGSFQFLADCTYPPSLPPHERFCRLRDLHTKYYWTVIIIDLVVMLAVLTGLGTIAVRIIWTTLFV